MTRSPLTTRVLGRVSVKTRNSSISISASFAGFHLSTRNFTAVVAESAASFQPAKPAITTGLRNTGCLRYCIKAILLPLYAPNPIEYVRRNVYGTIVPRLRRGDEAKMAFL